MISAVLAERYDGYNFPRQRALNAALDVDATLTKNQFTLGTKAHERCLRTIMMSRSQPCDSHHLRHPYFTFCRLPAVQSKAPEPSGTPSGEEYQDCGRTKQEQERCAD